MNKSSTAVESNMSQSAILELFYTKIGSSWLLDSLYLYLVIPLTVIGFLLNLLSFLVFFNLNVRKTLINKYLMFYTLCSCLILLNVLIDALSRIPRYSSVAFDPFIIFHRCVLSNFGFAFVFFISILDIFILFERLTHFKAELKSYLKVHQPILEY